jgi:LacI family transcriptional regulator
VLVVLNRTENDWRVLEGIANHNRATNWRIRLAHGEASPGEAIRRWQPDGVIFNFDERLPLPRDLPRIRLFRETRTCDWVGLDDPRIGAMGARYFLDKGFTSLVFLTGHMGFRSKGRFAGFRQAAMQRGVEVRLVESGSESGLLPSHQRDGAVAKLGAELRDMPGPVAVLALNDYFALDVIDACHQAGLTIPEQVSVLGVDNDAHVCAIARPALSSIRLPYRKIGERAAALLEERMGSGAPAPSQAVPFPPDEIVERESSSLFAVRDPQLSRALEFIRKHRSRPVSVAELTRASGASKTLLQNKFRTDLGRTPLQEIHRQRIEHAKEILCETSFSLEEIAARCGFSDQAQFSKLFRKVTGNSPGRFRAAHGRSRA